MIVAGLISRLFYKASLDSGDFLVYWRSAHAWITGSAFPYGIIDPSVPGFVFKYPPWILPLFTPFGFMSATLAKAVWAVLELVALFYAIRKLILMGTRPWIAVLSALSLWFIWQEQFWSGQITIFMMAAALWVAPMDESRSWPIAFVTYIFTAKLFSLATLLGRWKELLRPKALIIGAALALLPTVVVISVLRWNHPEDPIGLIELFQRFAASANSGGVSLGPNVIRGPINHGFTAAILRSLQIDSKKSIYDFCVPIILTLILAPLWTYFSKSLGRMEQWLGWLALGAVIHPLAWDHTFVLAFPLGAVAIDRALRTHRHSLVALAIMGLSCVGLLVPNIVGTEMVKPFDAIGAKSWGVVLSALALILSQRTQLNPTGGEVIDHVPSSHS